MGCKYPRKLILRVIGRGVEGMKVAQNCVAVLTQAVLNLSRSTA
jgi:hypothetical protein